MRLVRDLGYAVLLLFGSATSVFAQGTGDIVGRVSDASSSVVPGVSVTATNLATNIARTAVTSENGDYTFTLLPIGNYEVKTELAGRETGFYAMSARSHERSVIGLRAA